MTQSKFSTIRRSLEVSGEIYDYFSLTALEETGVKNVSKLPFSLKILLENLLRHEDGETVTTKDINAICEWPETRTSTQEIAYHPGRVLMQDLTGVPALVDLAAMREAMLKLGGDPQKINPLSPVDLVIDHSIQVDIFGRQDAYAKNTHIEIERNRERYEFLRWGQTAFKNFRVVPPGAGICHQVNLEYLGKTVWFSEQEGRRFAYPDTLVGTDSHTTMINGLGILGWGVGGIEAEAITLGQPISMLIPEVIGFQLTGKLSEGITATDLVLTITQMLRAKGVVNKFVEFYGPGLTELTIADRATISNMSPEFGATCGFFPVDQETINYLRLTGRDENTILLVETYCKAQNLWRDTNTPDPVFTDTLSLNLSTVMSVLAGPKRPQDKVFVSDLKETVEKMLEEAGKGAEKNKNFSIEKENYSLHHGDVMIAAITSCTNTSNPNVLMAAGLVAKKASEKGLRPKPWVKTSLAPGSKVVTDYLEKAGLQKYLDDLGFNLVGYGCTTCIGNSGPLAESLAKIITENDLIVSSVLSGNRNFEGRVHPLTKANWLCSPPLVVAYALAGTTNINLDKDPMGKDNHGNPVYLKDIWPSTAEIAAEVHKVNSDMFRKEYANIFDGDAEWRGMKILKKNTYAWKSDSTYVQNPPFFSELTPKPKPIKDIKQAHILAILGDSVTTDHISPAGNIKVNSPAGSYLLKQGVAVDDFNSYGSRRGNHEVMMRGTFANIRLRNEMVPNIEGGITKHIPTGKIMPIYDAAMKYLEEKIPLVIIAGKEYGSGSSRDWAAKGPLLLGVKAVITESFERIHRSNLIGMGILPLEFKKGVNRKTLKLDGTEKLDIRGIEQEIQPGMIITALITYPNGKQKEIELHCCIDTKNEAAYYTHGGILQYVLRKLNKK